MATQQARKDSSEKSGQQPQQKPSPPPKPSFPSNRVVRDGSKTTFNKKR